MPFGRLDELVIAIEPTVMDCGSDVVRSALSVKTIVKGKVPVAVGVPVSAPVAVLRFSPGGRLEGLGLMLH